MNCKNCKWYKKVDVYDCELSIYKKEYACAGFYSNKFIELKDAKPFCDSDNNTHYERKWWKFFK